MGYLIFSRKTLLSYFVPLFVLKLIMAGAFLCNRLYHSGLRLF